MYPVDELPADRTCPGTLSKLLPPTRAPARGDLQWRQESHLASLFRLQRLHVQRLALRAVAFAMVALGAPARFMLVVVVLMESLQEVELSFYPAGATG